MRIIRMRIIRMRMMGDRHRPPLLPWRHRLPHHLPHHLPHRPPHHLPHLGALLALPKPRVIIITIAMIVTLTTTLPLRCAVNCFVALQGLVGVVVVAVRGVLEGLVRRGIGVGIQELWQEGVAVAEVRGCMAQEIVRGTMGIAMVVRMEATLRVLLEVLLRMLLGVLLRALLGVLLRVRMVVLLWVLLGILLGLVVVVTPRVPQFGG
jgi:hypothetical protein